MHEKEYDFLKQEILQKRELHNSLATIMITTSITLISFAFYYNLRSADADPATTIPLLFLFPYFFILPLSLRMAL